MSSTNEVLFLCGSLMIGLPNHDQLSDDPKFLGRATTTAEYSLVDLGPYPGAVRSGTSALIGELYAVSRGQLAALDTFEGVPNFYRRVRTQLAEPEGSAWIYLLTTLPAGAPFISSGSWRLRLQER